MMLFITGSRQKFEEFSLQLANMGVGLGMMNVDLPEIQSLDPREVVEAKLRRAMEMFEEEIIVEDTSFGLSCLHGFPGPLIKWLLKSIGEAGVYELAHRYADYRAVTKTIIGHAKDGEIRFFEGISTGKVVSPRGDKRFAWDTIFVPDGFRETYAEMPLATKNKISQRFQAIMKLKGYLETRESVAEWKK